MLTPLEYTRYLKNSGRVTGEISHYTALDQYYAERGYPPVPENAPLVLRAAGGYLNSPRLGSGAYLRFMPYFREITEDIAVSPALLNLEMLSVTAKSFNGGTFLSEITTLTNIPSPIFCLRPAFLRIFF